MCWKKKQSEIESWIRLNNLKYCNASDRELAMFKQEYPPLLCHWEATTHVQCFPEAGSSAGAGTSLVSLGLVVPRMKLAQLKCFSVQV
jgi:hypothetical protein